MLALLAFSGLPHFNATNGMKNVLSFAINGVSVIPFMIARVIDWRYAIPMAVVALIGGYVGAHLISSGTGIVRPMVRDRDRRDHDDRLFRALGSATV